MVRIPRRVWAPGEVDRLVEALTSALRTPTGRQRLRPVQAIALYEAAHLGGLFAPIRVGGGKTLLSALLPRVWSGVVRPLVIVPAALREKTRAEFADLRRDWCLPPFIRVESYETLSTVGGAELLSQYEPDVIVADECHKLKHLSSACTKRVGRYLRARHREGRPVHFCAMTGSATTRSIREFAHLAGWALGDAAPVPADWGAVDEWSRALDVSVADHRRLLPGALSVLRTDPAQEIREAYRDRLTQSPGVVATQEAPLPIGLRIRTHTLEHPPEVDAAFRVLRDSWETPDGWACADGVEVWRHARELGAGYYYVWNPRPPEEWRIARRAWAAASREIIAHNRRHLDTELQARQAVHEGFYPAAAGILADWLAIAPTFEPRTEPRWISDHVLRRADAWAREAPGIVWTASRAVAAAMGERGWPVYTEGALTADGRHVRDARPAAGSIVASIASCGTGQNLQAWSRNLVIGVPPNGGQWEQLIGRTHRDGQRAPGVTFDVLLGSAEDAAALERSIADSRYAEAMTGQAQKLAHAEIVWSAPGSGFAWQK